MQYIKLKGSDREKCKEYRRKIIDGDLSCCVYMEKIVKNDSYRRT